MSLGRWLSAALRVSGNGGGDDLGTKAKGGDDQGGLHGLVCMNPGHVFTRSWTSLSSRGFRRGL